jgi:hypothetical protein
MGALKAILFNLYLPSVFAATAMAHVMAACNRRPNNGFDWVGSLACPTVPDEGMPGAAAMAVAILRERGETITDGFRAKAAFWFLRADECPPPLRDSVQRMAKEVWPDGQNPLARLNLPMKGFHQIVADMTAQFPKQFRNPEG